jgi:hypothetical protein
LRPIAADCSRLRLIAANHTRFIHTALAVDSQVLSGEIDVASALRAIPADRVRHMQESISMHAHRMHYGMGDTPGDALELLLRALDEAASQPLPARLQASLERANRHSACADAYPEQMRRTTLRAWKTLEAHELWKTAPRSCAALVGGDHAGGSTGGNRSGTGGLATSLFGARDGAFSCDSPVPSRKNSLFVRDICMRTCGRCPHDSLWGDSSF